MVEPNDPATAAVRPVRDDYLIMLGRLNDALTRSCLALAAAYEHRPEFNERDHAILTIARHRFPLASTLELAEQACTVSQATRAGAAATCERSSAAIGRSAQLQQQTLQVRALLQR